VRGSGGRVVAVGTTVVRALETAVGRDGKVHTADGWTDLIITPERGVRAVHGLLTGWHEPRASHLLMLEAVAGRPLLDLCYAEAIREHYLWHEFGDVNLLLP
jgi:S-adenosylmethionine:tRNA ribosyltransferase-isomerase